MKYTVEQIMKWKPCYNEEDVVDLVRDGLDAVGLSHLNIPYRDRIWVLIRMLYDVHGKGAVVDFAGNCALRAYYYATYYAAYAAAADTDAAAYAAADAADAAAAVNAAAVNADDAAAYAADATYAAYAYADAAYNNERQWQIDYLVEAIEVRK